MLQIKNPNSSYDPIDYHFCVPFICDFIINYSKLDIINFHETSVSQCLNDLEAPRQIQNKGDCQPWVNVNPAVKN